MKTKPFSVFNLTPLQPVTSAYIFKFIHDSLFKDQDSSTFKGCGFKVALKSLYLRTFGVALMITLGAVAGQTVDRGWWFSIIVIGTPFGFAILMGVMAGKDLSVLDKYLNTFNALHKPGEKMCFTFERILTYRPSAENSIKDITHRYLLELGADVTEAQRTKGQEVKARVLRDHFVFAYKNLELLLNDDSLLGYEVYLK